MKFYEKKYYISGFRCGEDECTYFNNKNEFLNVIGTYLDRFYNFEIHNNSGLKWSIDIQSGYIVNETSNIYIKGEPPKYIIKFLEELNQAKTFKDYEEYILSQYESYIKELQKVKQVYGKN